MSYRADVLGNVVGMLAKSVAGAFSPRRALPPRPGPARRRWPAPSRFRASINSRRPLSRSAQGHGSTGLPVASGVALYRYGKSIDTGRTKGRPFRVYRNPFVAVRAICVPEVALRAPDAGIRKTRVRSKQTPIGGLKWGPAIQSVYQSYDHTRYSENTWCR